MKYTIDYYEIEHGAHLFATPIFQRSENVECDNIEKVYTYIESKQDLYGGNYKKSTDKFMGYDYTSNQGGVKIKPYKEPKFKVPEFKSI